MKILMASRHCDIVGGIERFLYDSSAILKRDGHDIFGLFEHDGAGAQKDIFTRRWIRGADTCDAKTLAEIAEIAPDAVVVHKATDAAFLSELNKRFRTVAVIHDHDYYCIRRHKYFPIGRINCGLPFGIMACTLCSGMLSKTSGRITTVNPFGHLSLLKEVRNCAKTLVISDFMRGNLIMNGFPPDRICKINPPVQASKAHLMENKINGPFRILFVGQLIRGKGADLLIKAVPRLKTEFSLKIAGCGNDESLLRKMVSDLGLASRVEFIGRVSEIGTLYEWANTTVMPCRWQEPFGLVGVESMSHSRPVVAFDVGGISEWLRHGENGYLVGHGDIRALAETLDRLAGSQEAMRNMGAAGLEMVRSGYSDESFLSGFLKSLEI